MKPLFSTSDNAYILEESDIKLPFRLERKTHKGKFGHAVIAAGEKSGAGILAAEAALHFGAGLVSILKTPSSNLSQFKISPELMITDNYPKKTTAVLIGSGLGNNADAVCDFISWFKTAENPACVIDADVFGFDNLPEILSKLNEVPNARIVLTPHAKELCDVYKKCVASTNSPADTCASDFTPDEILNHRIEIGKAFTKKYPNITLVMKGSDTYIANKGETYVFDGGAQSLAKGGSGDVLAGMITALLAQGYTSLDAAITAVYRHGAAAREFGETAYNLTPLKLITLV